jgi:hypothetical protein
VELYTFADKQGCRWEIEKTYTLEFLGGCLRKLDGDYVDYGCHCGGDCGVGEVSETERGRVLRVKTA